MDAKFVSDKLADGLYVGSWWAQDTKIVCRGVSLTAEGRSPFMADKPVRVMVLEGEVQAELFTEEVEEPAGCLFPWRAGYPLSGQMVEFNQRLWCVATSWVAKPGMAKVRVDREAGQIVLVDISSTVHHGDQLIVLRADVRPVGFEAFAEVAAQPELQESVLDYYGRNQDED